MHFNKSFWWCTNIAHIHFFLLLTAEECIINGKQSDSRKGSCHFNLEIRYYYSFERSCRHFTSQFVDAWWRAELQPWMQAYPSSISWIWQLTWSKRSSASVNARSANTNRCALPKRSAVHASFQSLLIKFVMSCTSTKKRFTEKYSFACFSFTSY